MIKCFCMWPINSCDLIRDNVYVVDTMIFKRQLGSIKNKLLLFLFSFFSFFFLFFFCLRNSVVNDASCYLRNEAQPPSFCYLSRLVEL